MGERDERGGKDVRAKAMKGSERKRGTGCEMMGESDGERDEGEKAGLR